MCKHFLCRPRLWTEDAKPPWQENNMSRLFGAAQWAQNSLLLLENLRIVPWNPFVPKGERRFKDLMAPFDQVKLLCPERRVRVIFNAVWP